MIKVRRDPSRGSVEAVGSYGQGYAATTVVRAGFNVVDGEVVGGVRFKLGDESCTVNELQAAALIEALTHALIARQRIDANPQMALDTDYLAIAGSDAALFAGQLLMGNTIPVLFEDEPF